ncbi:hypothetical protein V1478_000015 [Vespula squamosa]|uniref:Uncharacterized protein n=1 Tax=Vespula squamosa TaxID=30214 RepID=A0ABD2C980_VESSQ
MIDFELIFQEWTWKFSRDAIPAISNEEWTQVECNWNCALAVLGYSSQLQLCTGGPWLLVAVS